jgi:drug/metabolite transporter (DMT)-like permease
MKTRASSQSSAALGVICAVGAATVFSTAGVIVRRIDLPAWDVTFWRSTLLLVTILPLIAWRRREVWIDVRNAGPALLASGLLLSCTFIAFILGLGNAPVANVLIMLATTPFLTALLARLALGEPLHRHTLAAIAAAAAGLALSVGSSLQAGALFGMAMGGVVALCMSLNYVIVRHRRDVGMTPSLAVAAVISALAALAFAHPSSATWTDIPWLLALGPGQLAAGLLLYLASLKHIPAGRAALIGLLDPVLGPIWVWLFDGEKPGDLTLLGGIIVIAAAATNVWLDSRRSTG